MSDEMMVQNSRPSATPYLLGGAVVGGLGGYELAKRKDFGIKTKAYKSWEDAVKDANKEDKFVSKQAGKEGENAANWKKVQEQRKAVADAEKAVKDAAGDLAGSEEIINYEKKISEVAGKENEMLQKLISGETKIGDKALIDTLTEDEQNKVYDAFKNANKDKEFKVGEETKKVANLTNEEIKGLKEFKEYAKTDETLVSKAKETKEYKKIAEDAKKDLEELLNKIKAKISDFNIETYKNALDKLKNAKDDAKKILTDEVIGKLKKPSNLWTAVAGAVVLGLGALLLRPKAKDDVA